MEYGFLAKLRTNMQTIAFGFAMLLLVLSGLSSVINANRQIEDSAWVSHTHEVQTELQGIQAKANKVVADLRGYLLTGDERFVAALEVGRNDLLGHFDKALYLTQDNASQQIRLQRLQFLIDRRLKLVDERLPVRRQKGLEAAAEKVIEESGEDLNNQIRGLVSEMLQVEQALLLERQAKAKSANKSAEAASLVFQLMAISLILMVVAGLRRQLIERRRAEALLMKTGKQLAMAQKIAHMGSFEYDAATQTIIWSEEEYRIYGLDPSGPSPNYAELLAKHVHPDDAALLNDTFMKAIESKSIFAFEHRIVLPDGGVRWVYNHAHPYFDLGGDKLVHYIGTTLDITDRKRLEDELKRQAHFDFLTGLSSRGYFMEQAEQELSRAIRYENPLSLFMMDIDLFKQINDTYGHKAGDTVLVRLAEVCRQALREVDIIGRIGGEEFAIFLPETGKEESLEVAERLRAALADTKIPLETGGFPLQITVSIGLTVLSSKDENVDVLLSFADKALYKAKNSGRNKVCASWE